MQPYETLLLYYFSGTGNALKATRWMKEHAKKRGMATQLFNIEEMEKPAVPDTNAKTLLGFLYPTHGFAPPWLVIKFLFRFPRLVGTDVFFANTRAGFRVLCWHNGPGLSGIAMWLPIVLFFLRGFRIVGSLPIDMPHSWISFFWPNSRRGVEIIVERCNRIVATFAEAVLSGRRYFRWSIWLTLPLDLAVFPITLLYVFFGRFMLSKTLFASYTCNDCGLCETHCPVGAIELKGGRPYWKYTCESCMRCMNICPKQSIESWVTRILLLTCGIVALGMVIYPMGLNVWFLVASVFLFPIYRLMHELWHIKAINVAFTFTSFTHVWRRYLAPGIRAKDLKQLE
jgi:NAD-dependent dihydropyrimidine dehydrogenase PreA subunit